MSANSSAQLSQATLAPERPIRVLTLAPFYPSAIDGTQGTFISEPLAHLGCSVINETIAVQPFYRMHHGPAKHQPAKWVRYFAFPSNSGLPMAGEFLARRLLKEVVEGPGKASFDLIHAHAALPCGHAASILSKRLTVPYVISVHGLDAFFTRQAGRIAGRWCRLAAEDVYHSAHAVICISEKVRAQVLERVTARTHVVYNGVDTERFAPTDEVSSSLTVLSVGNLIPIKGHRTLLRAFSHVSEEFPDSLLEIIGDGSERSRLEELAVELNIADRVRFHGRRSREFVAHAMRQCAVFALPSEYEGLGCVYLEAMSCAKPAIGCYGQGIEEAIEHGRTGMLVPPGGISQISDTLRVLLSNKDLRLRLGTAARQTVLERFAVQHQARRLAEIYDGCLA